MVCGFVGGETWVGDGEGKGGEARGRRSLACSASESGRGSQGTTLKHAHTGEERGDRM